MHWGTATAVAATAGNLLISNPPLEATTDPRSTRTNPAGMSRDLPRDDCQRHTNYVFDRSRPIRL
jgi:hypothetical protein